MTSAPLLYFIIGYERKIVDPIWIVLEIIEDDPNWVENLLSFE
jgi:hypothetical protein